MTSAKASLIDMPPPFTLFKIAILSDSSMFSKSSGASLYPFTFTFDPSRELMVRWPPAAVAASINRIVASFDGDTGIMDILSTPPPPPPPPPPLPPPPPSCSEAPCSPIRSKFSKFLMSASDASSPGPCDRVLTICDRRLWLATMVDRRFRLPEMLPCTSTSFSARALSVDSNMSKN